MAINKTIKVTLLSDLCAASGDGFAGFVDSDVCFGDDGLPYIPGKRLKGCLRECGLEIINVDDEQTDAFYELFGEKGMSTPCALNIGNGRLANYSATANEIAGAHRTEVMEAYTSIRSRTKMEDKKAAPGTLRTARVLNKGQVYEFPVALADEAKTVALLENCVKSLRSMGLNRSRGLGEIKCELVESNKQDKMTFEICDYGSEKAISYIIQTLEPVISADRNGKPFSSESYIFGSAILGAFASRYIKAYRLTQDTAHTDENFRQIFLEGKVKFTSAMPTSEGKTYFPAPMTLKTNKAKDRLSDESDGISDEDDDKNPICKRLVGFISIIDNKVKCFNPEKTTFIHHSRPADKGKGHAYESATEQDTGEMYSYEALSDGQTFAGSIIGSESHLKLLASLYADSNTIRIGRSRTAQYGKATISSAQNALHGQSAEHTKPNSYKLKNGDKFRLVTVTPLILEDENGINTTNIEEARKALGDDFEIKSYTCAETTVAGYNAKWLLPRGHDRAFAEGSVIVFEYKGAGTTLAVDFIGNRTGEGFGQIKIEPVPKPNGFMFAPAGEAKATTSDCASPIINRRRLKKEAIADGAEYGDKHEDKHKIKNSNLQRVITALRTSNSFESLSDKLCEIAQPTQKIAALVFATGENEWYFKTDSRHLEAAHIAGLMRKRKHEYAEYSVYKEFLIAAGQRIKQKKRDIAKRGGKEASTV